MSRNLKYLLIVIALVAFTLPSCHKSNSPANNAINNQITNSAPNTIEKHCDFLDFKNHITNGKFTDKLEGWSSNKKVCATNIDEKCCVEIKGNPTYQIRVWQTITMTSGHVYRLSFKSRSTKNGAFGIIRNNLTGKEEYLYCELNNNWDDNWIEYKEDFKNSQTGQYRVFLSCQGDGLFYFTDVSLYELNSLIVKKWCTIAAFIVLVGIVVFLLRHIIYSAIKFAFRFLLSHINDYFLLIIIPFACYYIGLHYSLVFLVWFLYFSSIHYLFYKKFKCPVFLTPLCVFSCIVLLLYINGLFCSLHFGYYFLILASVYGLFSIVKDCKLSFWKAFVFQPKEFWCYYIISFVLFLQSIMFSNGVTVNDDQHHWMFIMKGMGYYHSLKGFPIMSIFRNYTMGQALWGYFINRLSGSPFSINISHWSNVLIYATCFIPGLGFFKLAKNKIKLLSISLFILSFILLCYKSVYAIPVFIASFLFLPLELNAIFAYIGFSSYFLLYSFLLIVPNLEGSIYRNLPPDIIIYALPAACLIGYLYQPSLRSIIWLAPVISLGYLFKMPGLYYSAAVAITILLHFIIAKNKLIWRIFKKKTFLKYWIVAGIVLMLFALVLPPKIWNTYCKINEYDKNAMFDSNKIVNLSSVLKCFYDKIDPIYYKTRDIFWKRFQTKEVFKLNYDNSGPLAPFLFVDYHLSKILKLNFIPGTYPRLLILTFFIALIEIILLSKSKFKSFYLIFLLMLVFTCLNICGVFVNYCLMFTGSEKYYCPAYQRYASPMIKILIITIFGGFLIFLNSKKNKLLKTFLSLLVLLLTFSLCNAAGTIYHLKKHTNNEREKFYANLIPKDVDFKNKKLLIVGNNLVSRPNDRVGLINMYYKHSCPKYMNYITKDDSARINYYDYIFFLQDDIDISKNLSKNSFLNDILKRIENIDDLNSSCLFEVIKSNDFTHLKLIYKNPISPTNILFNSDFELGFKGWSCTDRSKVSLNNNDLTSVSLDHGARLMQSLKFKENGNYIIRFYAKTSNTDASYGYINNTHFYCWGNNKIKYSDTFIHSDIEKEVLLNLQNLTLSPVEFTNITVIDLGP